MEQRNFTPFGTVSALTLGGGGLGQVWGETTREEAVATVKLALDNGISHFDVAPMYGKGEAERVLGEALKGIPIEEINVTTKCRLGTLPDEQVYDYLNQSLTRSLDCMNLQRVDLFLLHSQLIEDDFNLFSNNETRNRTSTSLTSYHNAVIPAFERLKAEGKIGHWGIGGLGQQAALRQAINHETKPEAIQCVVNPLNSAGAIGYVDKEYDPRLILDESRRNEIPILGIRAVQAGALTAKMDRELHASGYDQLDFDDYERAAPFRELANHWNESAASLAHRYALSATKVSSVILGVKNRNELRECLDSEQKGKLTAGQIEEIEKVLTL